METSIDGLNILAVSSQLLPLPVNFVFATENFVQHLEVQCTAVDAVDQKHR